MSEPIQSIAQNNYILHNIDAKKLYVQEPLFTGNSGDAVYVGWRPDETVLWSGRAFTPTAGQNSAMTASVNLSESITLFDQVRLDFGNGGTWTESILISQPTTSNLCYWNVKKEMQNNNNYVGTKYKFTSETTLSGWCAFGATPQIDAMTGGYWGYGGVVRVVGINRKENA